MPYDSKQPKNAKIQKSERRHFALPQGDRHIVGRTKMRTIKLSYKKISLSYQNRMIFWNVRFRLHWPIHRARARHVHNLRILKTRDVIHLGPLSVPIPTSQSIFSPLSVRYQSLFGNQSPISVPFQSTSRSARHFSVRI